MIITEKVKIKGHPRNVKHFKSKGYKLNVGDIIEVDPLDLTNGSTFILRCACDNCSKEKDIQFKEYFKRTNKLQDNYYCKDCKWIKYEQTCLDKYGHKNAMQSEIIKSKLSDSILEKYGVDHYSKTDEYSKKYKKTCLQKYGVENPFKNSNIIDKIRHKRNSSTIKKFKNLLGEGYRIENYSEVYFKITHIKGDHTFKINKDTLFSRLKFNAEPCTICNKINVPPSSIEKDVCNFLEREGVEFETNIRDILNGKELDIFIPNKKLAIEVNGLYWHSELFIDKWYHIDKTNVCNEIGVELIHIFEDDWRYKNEIVKSLIRNRLGMIKNRIYARNCTIRPVNNKVSRKFLDGNHIQGYSNSKYKYGLYYNNELVSLMTFSKNRKQLELTRFCNKINTVVIGSASKLLSFFKKNHDFDKIVSYADISIFSGKLYDKLGFCFEHRTDPNYYWVVDGFKRHRFNYNKKKLVDQGFDPNKTGREIMLERGYYRIWSCGQDKYVLNS